MPYIEEAFRVLWANKIRTLLTMLGLIIGVGAVIAIQVLGNSMAGAVDGALGTLTDNSFVVFPSSTQRDVTSAAIRLRDLPPLRTLPGVVDAMPLGFSTELIRAGHAHGRFGISPDSSISFQNLPIRYGRHISDDDVAGAANVAVISDKAFQRLFPGGGDPTGESIYAGPNRYEIVGVQQPPKRGILNAQFSGDVTIPYTTYVNEYVRGSSVIGAGIISENAADIPQIEIAVQDKLRELHGNPQGLEYQTFDKAKFSQGIGGIFNALTIVVALIGAVALLVAGIGITNIMLVSVTERTREIGVRKAIGARSGQVLLQFFIEALLMCSIGCAIGLVIGLSIGAFVNDVFIVKITGNIVPLPWLQAVLIAVGFATIVTLACGTYPAYRAAKLDPIEALRYE
jgi:putative ABC transport system permease protein